jgi:hypothetical protein
MGRRPEDEKAREAVVGVRLTREERKQFDIQRWKRGSLTRGQYFRLLVAEDAKKLAEEA